MLHTLRRREQDTGPTDAIDMMLDCHRRIRHFTAVAVALPDATAIHPADIAAAAAGVARYFGEALPLHSADEDRSLVPRMLAHDAPKAVRVALDAMMEQHAGLERTLAKALPRWHDIASDPTRLDEHADALRGLAAQLSAQWDEHLGLEEGTIFPAARALLPPIELDVIAQEIRMRRGVVR